MIPLDSKFGFAWRDWRVLYELAGRTGVLITRRAAAAIADILGDRAADRRIETLQDRIHRLYAWWLIDRAAVRQQDQARDGALLALQNPDGGWHEVDTGPGPSAVYTTGQLAWTLLRIGVPRDHPAVAKALGYLRSQQQDFGGWFQTTTHENFRTPMRETRYAVMALAEAFPRPGAPAFRLGKPRRGRRGCRGRIAWFIRSTIWKTSGTCPGQTGRRFARRSRLCSNIRSRWSARPRPQLGRMGQSDSQHSWPRGSSTPQRSCGERPPGRYGGWGMRAKASM